MMMRRDWFPTPIWNFQHENAQRLNQSLLQEIEKEQARDPQGLNVSNVLGWHSVHNQHQREMYQEFIDIVTNAVLEIAQEIAWDLGQAKPIINNCWAIVNKKYAFNSTHHHPNSILSGVYYVKVPEHSGNLYFHDPRAGGQMLMPPFNQITPWTMGKVIYQPLEGMLVIVPSWLWHGVEPNLSEENRVSLSFNIGMSKLTVRTT